MDEHISLLQNNRRKFVASSFWESVNDSNHAQRITLYIPSFKTLQPDDEHNFVAVFLFQTAVVLQAEEDDDFKHLIKSGEI